MKKKTLIIITSVIGTVATVCTLAGLAIYNCVANFDNIQFIIDNCVAEETKD